MILINEQQKVTRVCHRNVQHMKVQTTSVPQYSLKPYQSWCMAWHHLYSQNAPPNLFVLNSSFFCSFHQHIDNFLQHKTTFPIINNSANLHVICELTAHVPPHPTSSHSRILQTARVSALILVVHKKPQSPTRKNKFLPSLCLLLTIQFGFSLPTCPGSYMP